LNSELLPLVFIISILQVILAGPYFLKSGPSLLLPSDSFVFASAVFIGVPGLLTCLLWPFWISREYLLVSLLGIGFSMSVALTSLLVRTVLVKVDAPSNFRKLDSKALGFLRQLTWLAIILSVLTATASARGAGLGPVPGNLGFLAVILAFVQLVCSGPRRNIFPHNLLIPLTALVSLAGYLRLYFDGGGRLIVATLFYALAAILGMWKPRWAVKKIIILSLIPAILFFGYIRGNTGDFKDVLVAADGLESLYGPYQICTDVVEHIDLGIMDFQKFEPLTSTLFFWVPRSLWPQKPFGFGFELTRHFRPQLVHIEHSMAATYLGEFYASAGILAVAVGFFWLVSCLTWLDLKMGRLAGSDAVSLSFVLRMIVMAILTAGIFDYVWVGSFTFFSRNILRLVLFAGMAGAVWASRFLVGMHRANHPGWWADAPAVGNSPERTGK
jgi:hypothetical protein